MLYSEQIGDRIMSLSSSISDLNIQANEKRQMAHTIALDVKQLQSEMEQNKALFESKLDKSEERIISEVETLNQKLLSEMNTSKSSKSCAIS